MNENKGIARLRAATINSWAGLRAAWRDEAAFRQECVALVIAVPLAWWLCAGNYWIFVALIASILQIMIVELLNSAIEAAIDRIGLERHQLSGKAKDVASAAVLLACLVAAFIWMMATWSRFAGQA